MKKLLLALGCIAMLSSCATTKPHSHCGQNLVQGNHICSPWWIYRYEWNETQKQYELIAYSEHTYTVARKKK